MKSENLADMIVPEHRGTPAEMLRDAADILDALDDLLPLLVFADGPDEGRSLADVLYRGESNHRGVQADIRWLADQLEQ